MILTLIGLLAAAAAPAPADPILGTWINARGTVVVQTARCRSGICGKIVWAAPVAQEKARAAGAEPLVGTEILSGFQPSGQGSWFGQAFVPDLGQTAEAQIYQTGPNELQIEGCKFRVLCKTQIWHRTTLGKKRRR